MTSTRSMARGPVVRGNKTRVYARTHVPEGGSAQQDLIETESSSTPRCGGPDNSASRSNNSTAATPPRRSRARMTCVIQVPVKPKATRTDGITRNTTPTRPAKTTPIRASSTAKPQRRRPREAAAVRKSVQDEPGSRSSSVPLPMPRRLLQLSPSAASSSSSSLAPLARQKQQPSCARSQVLMAATAAGPPPPPPPPTELRRAELQRQGQSQQNRQISVRRQQQQGTLYQRRLRPAHIEQQHQQQQQQQQTLQALSPPSPSPTELIPSPASSQDTSSYSSKRLQRTSSSSNNPSLPSSSRSRNGSRPGRLQCTLCVRELRSRSVCFDLLVSKRLGHAKPCGKVQQRRAQVQAQCGPRAQKSRTSNPEYSECITKPISSSTTSSAQQSDSSFTIDASANAAETDRLPVSAALTVLQTNSPVASVRAAAVSAAQSVAEAAAIAARTAAAAAKNSAQADLFETGYDQSTTASALDSQASSSRKTTPHSRRLRGLSPEILASTNSNVSSEQIAHPRESKVIRQLFPLFLPSAKQKSVDSAVSRDSEVTLPTAKPCEVLSSKDANELENNVNQAQEASEITISVEKLTEALERRSRLETPPSRPCSRLRSPLPTPELPSTHNRVRYIIKDTEENPPVEPIIQSKHELPSKTTQAVYELDSDRDYDIKADFDTHSPQQDVIEQSKEELEKLMLTCSSRTPFTPARASTPAFLPPDSDDLRKSILTKPCTTCRSEAVHDPHRFANRYISLPACTNDSTRIQMHAASMTYPVSPTLAVSTSRTQATLNNPTNPALLDAGFDNEIQDDNIEHLNAELGENEEGNESVIGTQLRTPETARFKRPVESWLCSNSITPPKGYQASPSSFRTLRFNKATLFKKTTSSHDLRDRLSAIQKRYKRNQHSDKRWHELECASDLDTDFWLTSNSRNEDTVLRKVASCKITDAEDELIDDFYTDLLDWTITHAHNVIAAGSRTQIHLYKAALQPNARLTKFFSFCAVSQEHQEESLTALSFSPCGELLAVATSHGDIKLYQPYQGRLIRDLNIIDFVSADPILTSRCPGHIVKISWNANMLSAVSASGHIVHIDSNTTDLASCVVVKPDYSFIGAINGQNDLGIRVPAPALCNAQWTSPAASTPLFVTCSGYGVIGIWDTRNGITRPSWTTHAHLLATKAVAWRPQPENRVGFDVATAGGLRDQNLQVWTYQRNSAVRVSERNMKNQVCALSWASHDLIIAATGYEDPMVVVFRVDQVTNEISCIAESASPDGSRLLHMVVPQKGKFACTLSAAGNLFLWDLQPFQ